MNELSPASDSLRDALVAALDAHELAISTGAVQWDRTSPGAKRDARLAKLQELVNSRQDIQWAIVKADLNSPAVAQAAAVLSAIAQENARIADRLVTVTGWLEAAADVLEQANKIMDELAKLARN